MTNSLKHAETHPTTQTQSYDLSVHIQTLQCNDLHARDTTVCIQACLRPADFFYKCVCSCVTNDILQQKHKGHFFLLLRLEQESMSNARFVRGAKIMTTEWMPPVLYSVGGFKANQTCQPYPYFLHASVIWVPNSNLAFCVSHVCVVFLSERQKRNQSPTCASW